MIKIYTFLTAILLSLNIHSVSAQSPPVVSVDYIASLTDDVSSSFADSQPDAVSGVVSVLSVTTPSYTDTPVDTSMYVSLPPRMKVPKSKRTVADTHVYEDLQPSNDILGVTVIKYPGYRWWIGNNPKLRHLKDDEAICEKWLSERFPNARLLDTEKDKKGKIKRMLIIFDSNLDSYLVADLKTPVQSYNRMVDMFPPDEYLRTTAVVYYNLVDRLTVANQRNALFTLAKNYAPDTEGQIYTAGKYYTTFNTLSELYHHRNDFNLSDTNLDNKICACALDLIVNESTFEEHRKYFKGCNVEAALVKFGPIGGTKRFKTAMESLEEEGIAVDMQKLEGVYFNFATDSVQVAFYLDTYKDSAPEARVFIVLDRGLDMANDKFGFLRIYPEKLHDATITGRNLLRDKALNYVLDLESLEVFNEIFYDDIDYKLGITRVINLLEINEIVSILTTNDLYSKHKLLVEERIAMSVKNAEDFHNYELIYDDDGAHKDEAFLNAIKGEREGCGAIDFINKYQRFIHRDNKEEIYALTKNCVTDVESAVKFAQVFDKPDEIWAIIKVALDEPWLPEEVLDLFTKSAFTGQRERGINHIAENALSLDAIAVGLFLIGKEECSELYQKLIRKGLSVVSASNDDAQVVNFLSDKASICGILTEEDMTYLDSNCDLIVRVAEENKDLRAYLLNECKSCADNFDLFKRTSNLYGVEEVFSTFSKSEEATAANLLYVYEKYSGSYAAMQAEEELFCQSLNESKDVPTAKRALAIFSDTTSLVCIYQAAINLASSDEQLELLVQYAQRFPDNYEDKVFSLHLNEQNICDFFERLRGSEAYDKHVNYEPRILPFIGALACIDKFSIDCTTCCARMSAFRTATFKEQTAAPYSGTLRVTNVGDTDTFEHNPGSSPGWYIVAINEFDGDTKIGVYIDSQLCSDPTWYRNKNGFVIIPKSMIKEGKIKITLERIDKSILPNFGLGFGSNKEAIAKIEILKLPELFDPSELGATLNNSAARKQLVKAVNRVLENEFQDKDMRLILGNAYNSMSCTGMTDLQTIVKYTANTIASAAANSPEGIAAKLRAKVADFIEGWLD